MKKIIMIAGGALVLVIVIAVLLFLFVFNKSEKAPEAIEYFEYSFSERYTNINAEKKILKYEMVIQYTDEEVKELIFKNEARIINDIVEYFRTRPLEQITSPSGQRKAREDILEILLEILQVDNEQLTDVFFTQFILQ